MNKVQQTQMSPKKFARRSRRGETLDVVNDQLYLDSPDDRIRHLHATKGFRSTSTKRMICAEGRTPMVSVFFETLKKYKRGKNG